MLTEKIEIKNLVNTSIPTITMYRINFDGKRGYVLPEPFAIYSGLTGALSAATFKGNIENKRITKWRDKMIEQLGGQDQQEAYLQSMADFGSIVHEAIVRIKENGCLNWSDEQLYATAYFEQSARFNGITPNSGVMRSQVFEYCKSVASILQWVYECVVEIYAIESMAKCDDLLIATPIDVVCRIKDKKSEYNVSVNIKTSGQIGNHQREQVAMERYLWNKTYPNLQVEKTGIIRPKDWNLKKGLPTYEFELLEAEIEQKFKTNAISRLKIALADEFSTYHNYPNTVAYFVGESKLGEQPKIETKTLEEIFNETEKADIL